MMSFEKPVGKVIRVEWDEETDEVRLVLEIIDPKFKERVLCSREFKDIITIRGKNALIISEDNKND